MTLKLAFLFTKSSTYKTLNIIILYPILAFLIDVIVNLI